MPEVSLVSRDVSFITQTARRSSNGRTAILKAAGATELDRSISQERHEALPHLTLANRVHLRVLGAVEFHRELRQIRKRSYHPVLWRSVRILLDLQSHRLGCYSRAPDLRTSLA